MVASQQTRGTSANGIEDVAPIVQRDERLDWLPFRGALQALNSQIKVLSVMLALCVVGVFSSCSILYMIQNAPFWRPMAVSLAMLALCIVFRIQYVRRYVELNVEYTFVLSFAIFIAWSQMSVCDATQPMCVSQAMAFHATFFAAILFDTFHSLAISKLVVSDVVSLATAQGLFFTWELHRPDQIWIRTWCEQTLFASVSIGVLLYILSYVKDKFARFGTAPRILWLIPTIAAYNGYLCVIRLLHWKLFMANHLVTQQ